MHFPKLFSVRINKNLESNLCENTEFADASYSCRYKLISELIIYAMVHFGFVETARFHAHLHCNEY